MLGEYSDIDIFVEFLGEEAHINEIELLAKHDKTLREAIQHEFGLELG